MIAISWNFRYLLAAAVVLPGLVAAQSPMNQGPPGQQRNVPEFVKDARQLNGQGKQDEAIAALRKGLQDSPNSFDGHLALGTTLDLNGQYDEARKEIARAIELAPSPEAKWQAEKTMAISYAFDRKAKQAEKYERDVFDAQLAAKDYYAAGETADELARIYIESGDLDDAYKWYKTGYETGLKQSDITESRKNVWAFRWENAQARIAARSGNREEAQKHLDAAKADLDQANDPQQQSFYPYLTGYVAFYEGDYKKAIAELQQANQRDPFILSLLAQAYEKTGDQAQAMELYRKILTFNMHNPTNAFARPLAKQKVG
jgi:tetratricopeptide (TPR) repeat protein